MYKHLNFSSLLLLLLLNTAGISAYFQKKCFLFRLLKCYLLYSFVILTLSQLLVLKTVLSVTDTAIALVYINNGLFFNGTTLILHLKRDNLRDLFGAIGDHLVRATHPRVESANSRFKRFCSTYGVGYCVIYSIAGFGPALMFVFSNKRIDDINALLLPCVVPWTIDSNFKYWLTIVLQMSWLLPLSIPTIFNFLFVVYFAIEVHVQYDSLCESLKSFEVTSENIIFDERLSSLERIVRHHQLILRFVKNFNACYDLIFAANLMYSVANLSLLLLIMITGDKSFDFMLRIVMTFLMVLFHTFLYCFIGQVLENANDKFKTTLYDHIKWYESCTKKLRSSLLIVMCSTQRMSNLRAAYSYISSFELFYNLLKLSFSYYNIISQAFGDKN